MHFVFACVALAAALLFAASAVHAQAKKDKDKPQSATFDNGFKVIVIPTKRHSMVVTAIFYKIGTGDDMPGKAGLAHLISQVVQHAASNAYKEEAAVTSLQKAGFLRNPQQDVGANIFYDVTCHYSVLGSEKLDLALRVEAERVTGLVFTPEVVKREAEKIMEQLRASKEDLELTMHNQVRKLAYTVHPYRFPVAGIEKDVMSINLDLTRGHYDTFYMPNSATLVIVGKVNPESTIALVKKYFSTFPAGALVETIRKEEPPQTGSRGTILRADIPAEKFMMGFVGAGSGTKMQAALLVIMQYLKTELKKRLVDGGKAAEVAVSYDWLNVDPGLFLIKGTVPEKQEHVPAAEMIYALFSELADKGIDAALLEQCKEEQYQAVCALQSDLSALAGKKDEYVNAMLDGVFNIGRCELVLGHKYEQFKGLFKALTNDDIETAAATFLDKKRANLVVAVPEKE